MPQPILRVGYLLVSLKQIEKVLFTLYLLHSRILQHRTAGRTNEVLSSVSPLPSSALLLGELRRQVRVYTNWSVGKLKIMLNFKIPLSVCRSHLQTASEVKPAVSNMCHHKLGEWKMEHAIRLFIYLCFLKTQKERRPLRLSDSWHVNTALFCRCKWSVDSC